MSMHLTAYPLASARLTSEERAMLKEGHALWLDFETYTQDKVDKVKELFRRVFALPAPTPLVGLTFPDAIVLQPEGSEQTFYAMVMSDDSEDDTWEAMRLTSEGLLCWVKTTPFRLVLALLKCSTCGMTTDIANETEGSLPSDHGDVAEGE